jgi:alpha,alpha-trehalose-phosphate synthase [UDP-forming]
LRRTLTLLLPLAISVFFVSSLFTYHQIRSERRNLTSELTRRSAMAAENIAETMESSHGSVTSKSLSHLLHRYVPHENLRGIAVYDPSGDVLANTPGLPSRFDHRPLEASQAAALNTPSSDFVSFEGATLFVYSLPVHRDDEALGIVVVVSDASYIQARLAHTLRASIYSALLQAFFITSLAFILVRWNFIAPLANTARWLRTLRSGTPYSSHPLAKDEMFEQIHSEVRHLAQDLSSARAAAQEEAQLRESQSALWTPDRLRVSLHNKLQDNSLCVVSNREPYMHVFNERDHSIQIIIPASGVVTALEPVLDACHGTWIANGSGSADREVVDHRDHLQVPPSRPTYTLRRVWLTPEEDRRYYEGFSNEGLWPLCHIAHTRPIFRPEDWREYQRINQRFADAVVQEMQDVASPVVLVQDYHFALLPRMLKEARPDARVAIFWHIPWPNPEVFGICPWQRELLDGLLGADLIGFHIRTHCSNFLGTVDHALEALTDWDRFEIYRQGHVTRVRSYPISVAPPPNGESSASHRSSGEERAALCEELGVEASLLGVGVDRVDYTKGILERFRGIERFLENFPAYLNRFSFIQIGAPSRTDIPRYRQFLEEVGDEASRINARFQSGRWKPIVFLQRHHSHQEIARFYRAASVCLVTSLHDGMNLVAKEFIAARDDNRGVLILSSFTGAAQELRDALLINPYDVDQLSRSIGQALEMDEAQQQDRMARMRKIVLEHNVYRWAANLISDLTEIRVQPAQREEAVHVP